jgi:anti-sigma regulatory factor (Ser/Thr protein kinase)
MMKVFHDLNDLKKIFPTANVPDELHNILDLKHASKFLEFLNSSIGKTVFIKEFKNLSPWAILVLASYGSRNDENKIHIYNEPCEVGKFAYALGLDEIINDSEKSDSKLERNRTVKLTRIQKYDDIEPLAEKISALIISSYDEESEDQHFEKDEVRKTIRYILVELLRNIIQHSGSSIGGLVLAQRDKDSRNANNCRIQIAVADNGVGIYDSLLVTRKEITDPTTALLESLNPGVSGKFSKYQARSSQNAGMGLFFISEMAKLTSGEFFIASKGASIIIKGDHDGEGNNNIAQSDIGFDGTLVVFEMPKRGVADYDSLITKIQEKARIIGKNNTEIHWIRFDPPIEKHLEVLVSIAVENTVQAEEWAKSFLLPRINMNQVLCLNFINIPIGTQSFIHSLLFEVVRLAYTKKVNLYVCKVAPSIKSAIKLLENYGLSAEDEENN